MSWWKSSNPNPRTFNNAVEAAQKHKVDLEAMTLRVMYLRNKRDVELLELRSVRATLAAERNGSGHADLENAVRAIDLEIEDAETALSALRKEAKELVEEYALVIDSLRRLRAERLEAEVLSHNGERREAMAKREDRFQKRDRSKLELIREEVAKLTSVRQIERELGVVRQLPWKVS